MSTVMPFFLIFSTIGYVPLGMLSWTEGCDEVSFLCCWICYRSWDCCNFSDIYFQFDDYARFLYVLHEKLVAERSFVSNILTQLAAEVKVWSPGWPPKSLSFRTENSRNTNPPVMEHCRFYFQLNGSMVDRKNGLMSLYGWRKGDSYRFVQPPSCTWSTGFHRFWGQKSCNMKTCRQASSSEQLLGVVVDWFMVHFAPRVWWGTMLICVDDVGVVMYKWILNMWFFNFNIMSLAS